MAGNPTLLPLRHGIRDDMAAQQDTHIDQFAHHRVSVYSNKSPQHSLDCGQQRWRAQLHMWNMICFPATAMRCRLLWAAHPGSPGLNRLACSPSDQAWVASPRGARAGRAVAATGGPTARSAVVSDAPISVAQTI